MSPAVVGLRSAARPAPAPQHYPPGGDGSSHPVARPGICIEMRWVSNIGFIMVHRLNEGHIIPCVTWVCDILAMKTSMEDARFLTLLFCNCARFSVSDSFRSVSVLTHVSTSRSHRSSWPWPSVKALHCVALTSVRRWRSARSVCRLSQTSLAVRNCWRIFSRPAVDVSGYRRSPLSSAMLRTCWPTSLSSINVWKVTVFKHFSNCCNVFQQISAANITCLQSQQVFTETHGFPKSKQLNDSLLTHL